MRLSESTKLPKLRYNDALHAELKAMLERVEKKVEELTKEVDGNKTKRTDRLDIWLESWVRDPLATCIAGIEGERVHLQEYGVYLDVAKENPLKVFPFATWVEAARVAWEEVKDNENRKRYFTYHNMDKALRSILPDETAATLPRFIEGRQWAPYLTKLVRAGVLIKVDLYGPRSKKPSGAGYVLHERYQRSHRAA
jgi:hypothetical protein